jgi:hypothetical protein
MVPNSMAVPMLGRRRATIAEADRSRPHQGEGRVLKIGTNR